jgi:hypothetical protein
MHDVGHWTLDRVGSRVAVMEELYSWPPGDLVLYIWQFASVPGCASEPQITGSG